MRLHDFYRRFFSFSSLDRTSKLHFLMSQAPRLNLAFILQLSSAKFYVNMVRASGTSTTIARPLPDAYPSLADKLVFYGDSHGG